MENENIDQRQKVINSIKSLLQPHEIAASREDLFQASEQLKTVAPYNYEAWRLHADLLLSALRRLETREIQPDPSFTLLAIPLRENDIRDAAEAALRQCAFFADSSESAVAFVDHANRIRRQTWF